MGKLIAGDKVINKAIAVDSHGDVAAHCVIRLPDRAEGEAQGTPIRTPEHLAGYVNSLLKQHYHRETVVPSGGVLLLYDEGNRIVAKFRWVPDPKKGPKGRSVHVLENKITFEQEDNPNMEAG